MNIQLNDRKSRLSASKQLLLEKRLRGESLPPQEAHRILRRNPQEEASLSYAQQRLWFLQQLEPESPAYNIHFGLKIQGWLDVDALRFSFAEIVRRHEVLRTTFPARHGKPVPVISSEPVVTLQEVDLRGLSENLLRTEAGRQVSNESRTPFDLARGPLLRVKLLLLGNEEFALLVTMHHIVSDGWSMSVLVRELTSLYRAHIEGKQPPLPPLEIQYADFAGWQQQWLRGEVLEKQLSYWRKQLAGNAPLVLPADRPRSELKSYRGGVELLQLDETLTGKLRRLSQQEGTTMFMTLLAAFHVLMARYGSQTDITVGSPIAGRSRIELEPLVGFFVNVLPLRANLGCNPTFREFLREVKQTVIDGYAHQDVPFEKLVEELQPERDLSRSPLFQVMFTMQNVPFQDLELGEMRLAPLQISSETVAKFELSLDVAEGESHIRCRLEYASELFVPDTMQRLLRHWQQLLQAATESPEIPVLNLPLLDQQEARQILEEWNSRKVACNRERDLLALFEDQARQRPEAVALRYYEQQLTYGELNLRANRLAQYLGKRGIGPEVLVGLCLDRSLEMIVAILGVLKAGGAYVPLNPLHPPERLNAVLEDAQIGILLTQARLREVFLPAAAKVIALDESWKDIALEPPERPKLRILDQNAAYVIYTSGSTGEPKGVVVQRGELVVHFDSLNFLYLITPADTILLIAAFTFDVSVTQMFLALSFGAQLEIFPDFRSEAIDPFEFIARRGISVAEFPTALWVAFSDSWPQLNTSQARLIIVGSEDVPVEGVRRWQNEITSKIALVNSYGPTETIVECTEHFFPCDQPDVDVLIGRPLPNRHAYVLDGQLCPVPAGVHGQLYIGGTSLARGYLGRPDLTAAMFLPDPHGEAGSRMYRTGDTVRWRANGRLKFIGRADNQIKIRGHRVELGEIESMLARHPAVREVVVVQRKEGTTNQLLACLVPHEAGYLPVPEVREYLRGKLPEHMVPAGYVVLEKMPVRSSGKVDRQILETLKPQFSSVPQAQRARTLQEELICGIWEEVLHCGPVGITDNFFDLGGHSLLATQVLARINDVLGIQLPVRRLFEAPTIADLARAAEQLSAEATAQTLPAIERTSRENSIPLSFAQQRLWFLDQMQPGSAAYNLPFGVRLEGELDRKALIASVNEIVRRHEVLRTRIVVEQGEAAQKIEPELVLRIEEIDLRDLSESARQQKLRQLADQEAALPFDLEQGPLLRMKLLQLARADHVLLVTIHHIAGDGWSMGVLVGEFIALYQAFTSDSPSPLPELWAQYADYSVWQRKWLQGDVLDMQLDYWRRQLAGVPALEWATDGLRPSVKSDCGAVESFDLCGDVVTRLRGLARHENVTLFMIVLAAFQVLVGRLSGEEDIAVGAAVANRNYLDTEALIGFFVNTLVLRTKLKKSMTVRELLRFVRHSTLEAYRHQDVPFEKIVQELAPGRTLDRTPLFQVMLIFQNLPVRSGEMAGIKASLLEDNSPALRSDLDLYITANGEGLGARMVYDPALFDSSSVKRILNELNQLLGVMASRPECKLMSLMVPEKPRLPELYSQNAMGPAPLSFHQERMWFIDRFETGVVYPSNPVYHNIPLVLQFEGALDPDLFKRSLDRLAEKHSTLRTRIVYEDDKARQVAEPGSNVPFEVLELNSESTEEGISSFLRLMVEAPLNMQGGPLFRASLLRNGKRDSALVMVAHHAIVDRLSMKWLGEELGEIYTAAIERREPNTSGDGMAYSSFARWQRGLTSEQWRSWWLYWKSELRDDRINLELPLRRPRHAIHIFKSAIHKFTIPERVANGIAALAAEQQTNTFNVLWASWYVLLHLYSGQDGFLVGISDPCRNTAEIETAIGPYSNLLPVRGSAAGHSFAQFLASASQSLLQARNFADLPFDLLVQKLRLPNDMSRTALFDVLFHFEPSPQLSVNFGSVQGKIVETNLGHGKYDLNLLVQAQPDGFAGTLVYNEELYDYRTIQQMARHFERLLCSVISNPSVNLNQLQLLDGGERKQQFIDWNSTAAHYPASPTLAELFEQQVRRTPDHIALIHGDLRFTYSELNQRANQLARLLRKRGVRPDMLVGICIERSHELLVAILAVLKAGGGYLPLDPSSPQERLEFMLEDAKVSHLISPAEVASRVHLPAELILLDRDEVEIETQELSNPSPTATPANVAYCIYTSGSTGRPNGVMVEHRQVVRLMKNNRMRFDFGSEDVWTLFHSYCFDFSVWEMWGALLYGGKLVVVPRDTARDPRAFAEMLRRQKVSVLNQTPASFYNVAAEAIASKADLALRYVIFGGEALQPAYLKEWTKAYPHVTLINMYGITETTVHVTWREVHADDIEENISNIGTPIPTTATYILNANMEPVPVGVTGEIYVGGEGLARGYLNRPDLTATRFVPDALSGDPGKRLYKTGDLARYVWDGSMVYMGRKDHQIKIRGYRIELGEIEAVLLAEPQVSRATALLREDNGQKQLVAYVVGHNGAKNVEIPELRQMLQQKLPAHMVPAAIVALDELPLTSNGKIDRRALPAPRSTVGQSHYRAPRNDEEEILCRIYEEVLAIDQVGIEDNFFELGGHSLLATRLISRVRSAFSMDAPLRILFESPTVAALAGRIRQERNKQTRLDLPQIIKSERKGPRLLSFAQQRLWFIHQLDPDSSSYNIPIAVRLTGPVDAEALRWSFQEILRRHEILRTRFPEKNGAAVQEAAPLTEWTLDEIDLSAVPHAGRESEARTIIEREAEGPFSLETGPVLRVKLLKLDEQDHVLTIVMHHIVGDEWSLEVLSEELAALYRSRSTGKPLALPEPEIQYADFAEWQREWLQGERLDQQLGYWKKQLAGIEELQLPYDHPGPASGSYHGGLERFTISGELNQQLRRLCRVQNVSLYMLLLAAFQVLLAKYSGKKDIVVGSPIANRNHSLSEKLIGFLSNMVVLRTDLSEDPGFTEVLKQVRETALAAHEHQDLPFELLVEELQPDRTAGHPLVQVVFSLRNAQKNRLDLGKLKAEPVEFAASTASKFDLLFSISDGQSHLDGIWEYNSNRFESSTVEQMSRHFIQLLTNIVAAPDARISGIQVLPEQELQVLTQKISVDELVTSEFMF